MKVSEVERVLEEWLPARWAEAWDNVGLLVGHPSWEVKSPMVVLDVTEEAVRRAVAEGRTLLLSHHPLLFSPVRRLDFSTPSLRVAASALQARVALLAAHTNWDNAPDGVNVILARSLGLSDLRPLRRGPDDSWGVGVLGNLVSPEEPQAILDRLRRVWRLSWVHYYGPLKPIRSLALCGGSGADLYLEASIGGADLFVTADVKYHQVEAILAEGLALAVIDHGEMERVSLPALARGLASRMGCDVAVSDDRALPVPFGTVFPFFHDRGDGL
ncbi:Nif3-like dinuclear metal center hexameric protein [Aminithiophilus ramosus]|uniref:GTP cyclohydrolase 1 type 2 homolog n=2 Tax=Synergistales TaxID=649776 RepID=A0A9Q7AP28_9BACT|nr:Nif3-like dinuclear metal center hexameric protein [Aminithiophilus ramosus]QTX32947.1 Nif3-like dinuclear metal center hexameric protein [Aminithiophilus ramosus]QVL37287.1 Nif3-like dinuclear metal center hexameric protein [Synergistota bacterium]